MISINTGDGREHIKDMTTDVPVMPRLKNLYKGRDIPIQLWKSIPMGQDLGIEQFGGETTRQAVGIVGTGVDAISATDPLDNVHVYNSGFIDTLDAKAGEHTVWDGAYVGQLTAADTAIVNIYGHVGRLIVDSGSQVIVHEGAYVDHMEVKPFGYARVEPRCAIHYLCIRIDGMCMLDSETKLHTLVADPGNRMCRWLSQPTETPMFQVEMGVCRKEKFVELAKELTDMYKKNHNELKFDHVSLWQIHHCQATMERLYFCANYARSIGKSADPVLPLPQAVYQDLKIFLDVRYKNPSLPGPWLQVWYKGKKVDMTPHNGWMTDDNGMLIPIPKVEEE